MKDLPRLILVLLTATCFVAAPAQAKKTGFSVARVEPLPFPDEGKSAPVLSLDEIEAKVEAFNDKIGGYPPGLKDARERQAMYEAWSAVVLAAEALRKKSGDSERVAAALATLYRQGHNMDVKQCGARAHATIADALKAWPDSIPVNFQASYFYLQISPKFAPQGEQALLKLRTLLHTDQNLEVERGFIYAYLYQDRIPEAQKQIDHCLKISPKDEMLLHMKEALKDGKVEKKQN